MDNSEGYATIINDEYSNAQVCTECIICGALVKEYDHPQFYVPRVCDGCKEAIRFAKELMKKQGN